MKNRPEVTDAVRFLNEGHSVQAFRSIQQMVGSAISVGWNKLWIGSDLYGWYGSQVTVQPLRTLALEIEADETTWDKCRQLLTHNKVNRLLLELGGGGTKLLQRLNLDRREKPFIERWRWSGNTGLAMLSDGGRFQIKRELVWARTIEASLDQNGQLGRSVGELLEHIDHEKRTIMCKFDGATADFVRIIRWYGLGRHQVDRMSLAVSAGDFPRLALDLWSSGKCAGRTPRLPASLD
ncbi:MAG: hypothetical protein P9M15_00495 [Candidatus Electryoneaceae bacterium]|nr:hypothetical protein [Candidatus Electryoneaceae bacterium]